MLYIVLKNKINFSSRNNFINKNGLYSGYNKDGTHFVGEIILMFCILKYINKSLFLQFVINILLDR